MSTAKRTRLSIRRETLRRLDSLSSDALAKIAGGTDGLRLVDTAKCADASQDHVHTTRGMGADRYC